LTTGAEPNNDHHPATRYETVIGLEVHVQLLTERKMFCDCSAAYADAPPNTHFARLYGAARRAAGDEPARRRDGDHGGARADCEIPEFSKFDRKNYPYPDLLKATRSRSTTCR